MGAETIPIKSLTFVDCDQLADLVTGGDISFLPLGTGPCDGSMMRIDLEGLYLLLTKVSNRNACLVTSQKGLRVVHIPLRWKRSLYWNGEAVSRTGVIVWGDSCDYCRVGYDVETIAVVIDESMLRNQIETLSNSSHSLWDTFNGQMLAGTPAALDFIRKVEWVLGLAMESPERLRIPEVRAHLREQLLIGLIEAVEAPGEHVSMGKPIARDRTRIVRQLTDFLHANPDRILEMSDLCRMTGFSARSIAYAFQTVLEISPIRYLKQIRLNRARILLREGTYQRISVSECAYSAGFSHLGRFSADYKRQFGESPKQTLARSR